MSVGIEVDGRGRGPQRVLIVGPSYGAMPIEVSRLVPSRMAVTLAPLPR